jgi:monovalent cation:proton antiporter-2 (CPA2) family protein
MNLQLIATLLACATISVPVCRWLRISPVLGYLFAGILAGPSVSGWVSDVEDMQHASEFGIVMLLFVIGLELQPSRLWALRRAIFGLGGSQMLLCSLVGASLAMLMGLDWQGALLVGFALSLASTPLVLQTLKERNELASQHGRAAFGILLFQDVAVLPVLAAVPLIGASAAGSGAGPALWLMLGKLVALLVLLGLAGRLLLRPALRILARAQVPEAFTAGALLVVIGTAMLANGLGMSMALGAFIAGVLLADSEFRHQLEADIEPFKGLLLGLFFMSVGMATNLAALAEAPGAIAGLALLLMALKVLLQAGLGRLFGQPVATAWSLGFVLCTGGEFAFVLLSMAAGNRALATGTVDALVLAVTLSMIASPLLYAAYLRWVQPRFASETGRPYDEVRDDASRVIIAGFGRFGQIVGRVLTTRGIRYTALDASQTQVDFVRDFGNKVYYGDAARIDVLRAAGAGQAEVLVLAIDDVEASVRAAAQIRQQFPHLRLFARARNRQHSFQLMDAGVHYLIRETLVSSLEMAQEVMESLGSTRRDAERAIERFRAHDQATLLRQHGIRDNPDLMRATSREAAAQLRTLFDADKEESADDSAGRKP